MAANQDGVMMVNSDLKRKWRGCRRLSAQIKLSDRLHDLEKERFSNAIVHHRFEVRLTDFDKELLTKGVCAGCVHRAASAPTVRGTLTCQSTKHNCKLSSPAAKNF